MSRRKYDYLVSWIGTLIKYFFVALFGFGLSYLISSLLGATHIATLLLTLLGPWFWRCGILLACSFGAVVLVESLGG